MAKLSTCILPMLYFEVLKHRLHQGVYTIMNIRHEIWQEIHSCIDSMCVSLSFWWCVWYTLCILRWLIAIIGECAGICAPGAQGDDTAALPVADPDAAMEDDAGGPIGAGSSAQQQCPHTPPPPGNGRLLFARFPPADCTLPVSDIVSCCVMLLFASGFSPRPVERCVHALELIQFAMPTV